MSRSAAPAVLLLDGSRSGAGADRVPTDGSLSSNPVVSGARVQTLAFVLIAVAGGLGVGVIALRRGAFTGSRAGSDSASC
jgi:uncharacterized protein (DUF58 family)